jgi:SAM-dependent methyltransferase
MHHTSGLAPWEIGRPQPAFESLLEEGVVSGRVLDAGCGTGEHVLMAARRGLDAIGVDLSPVSVDRARSKAAAAGVDARFVVGDALALDAVVEDVDTVLDCGLLHLLSGEHRAALSRSVLSVLRPGGRYLALGGWGPHPLSVEDVRAAFSAGWSAVSVRPATVVVNVPPGTLPAVLVEAVRA